MKKYKDKYYVPSLEEFYIGFEFEYRNHFGKDVGIWTTEKTTSFSNLKGLLNTNSIRVKYLNKKDIIELGFKDNGLSSSRHDYFFRMDAPGKLGYWTEIALDFRWGIEDISIKGFRGNEEDYLFRGIIKNKSELKKLLKQLNVI